MKDGRFDTIVNKFLILCRIYGIIYVFNIIIDYLFLRDRIQKEDKIFYCSVFAFNADFFALSFWANQIIIAVIRYIMVETHSTYSLSQILFCQVPNRNSQLSTKNAEIPLIFLKTCGVRNVTVYTTGGWFFHMVGDKINQLFNQPFSLSISWVFPLLFSIFSQLAIHKLDTPLFKYQVRLTKQKHRGVKHLSRFVLIQVQIMRWKLD